MNCSSRSGVCVQLGEHRLAGVLDLVLRLPGLERLGRGRPRSDRGARWPSRGCRRCRPGCSCRGRARVSGVLRVARRRARRRRARRKPQRHQRVGEVGHARADGARAPAPSSVAGHRALAERGEQLELDRGQQRLRRPEAHADLHDVRRIPRACSWRRCISRQAAVGAQHPAVHHGPLAQTPAMSIPCLFVPQRLERCRSSFPRRRLGRRIGSRRAFRLPAWLPSSPAARVPSGSDLPDRGDCRRETACAGWRLEPRLRALRSPHSRRSRNCTGSRAAVRLR